jgi:D-lactate dehydrogenase (cytochrome)
MLSYVSDGNFHKTLLFNGAKERDRVVKCVHDIVYRAIKIEGICTVSILHF